MPFLRAKCIFCKIRKRRTARKVRGEIKKIIHHLMMMTQKFWPRCHSCFCKQSRGYFLAQILCFLGSSIFWIIYYAHTSTKMQIFLYTQGSICQVTKWGAIMKIMVKNHNKSLLVEKLTLSKRKVDNKTLWFQIQSFPSKIHFLRIQFSRCFDQR